jgi:hypothetical protein
MKRKFFGILGVCFRLTQFFKCGNVSKEEYGMKKNIALFIKSIKTGWLIVIAAIFWLMGCSSSSKSAPTPETSRSENARNSTLAKPAPTPETSHSENTRNSSSAKPTPTIDEYVKALLPAELDEKRYANLVRFLNDREKVYLYHILLKGSEKGKADFVDQLMRFKVSLNSNDTASLSDFYVKIEQDDQFYTVNKFISYDSFKASSGGTYPAAKDKSWGSFGSGIPSEAERGGMGAGFVKYDYYDEFTFNLNYPAELRPLTDIAIAVGKAFDYDFKKAYGVDCKFYPGQKFGVCDDYVNYTIGILKDSSMEGITELYKVSSSKMNHAWIELVYKGKTVYFDPTWFDINQQWQSAGYMWGVDKYNRSPSEVGYSIKVPQDVGSDWDYYMVTYNKDLFDKGFSRKRYSHYAGGDAVKERVY